MTEQPVKIRQLKKLRHFVRPYRKRVVVMVIAVLLAALSVLALGRGIQNIIDSGFLSRDHAEIDQSFMILLCIVLLVAAASFIRSYLVSWLGERIVSDMRQKLFSHLLTLDIAFYETNKVGEITSRLTGDLQLIQAIISSTIPSSLRNGLLLTGGTIMLMITSLKMTLLVFAVIPLILVPVVILGRRMRKLSRKSQDRIADMNSYANEALSAIKTVQAYTHEQIDRATFSDRAEQGLSVFRQRFLTKSMLSTSMIAIAFSAISLILWMGVYDALAGKITGGELASFVFYAALVAGALSSLSDVMGNLQRSAGSTERFFELLNTKPSIKKPENPAALPTTINGKITFDQVSFSYPAYPEKFVLKDFTLTIQPGEKVAIVGPSGAGKSTLFNLLLRFYDPMHGEVFVDDLPIQKIDPEHLRQHIGLVAQDPFVFSATAAENILYGRPTATHDEMLAAAASAHAVEFIENLPNGFDTFLGEKAIRLSGGQRQRIAIARALLRNPSILLLDEATSALDAQSEHMIQKALDQLMQNRTTLVIAHRLATIRKMDRILVLENGHIIDQGTHEELLKTNELYARLAKLQFAQSE